MIRTTAEVFTVTCTSANTEYSVDLPPATTIFVQARANDLKLAHRPGDIADGIYISQKAASPARKIPGVAGARTLYVASGTNGAVLEVEVWY